MFLPIEPAFGLAVQNDIGLFNEAFEKNIVIVSPSTLLATLRTIASIWRQENQNKNALEIARQSGALYDKFVGFVEDLIAVGNKIDSSKDSYVNAMKKLHEGSGNLVSRVERIKKLGAKTTKGLPQSLLDKSDNDENGEPSLLE
jgi:DNA recombination protein RmuC